MSYQTSTINIMYLHPRKYNVTALTQFTLTPAHLDAGAKNKF